MMKTGMRCFCTECPTMKTGSKTSHDADIRRLLLKQFCHAAETVCVITRANLFLRQTESAHLPVSLKYLELPRSSASDTHNAVNEESVL